MEDEEDAAARADEVAALSSIYGEDAVRVTAESNVIEVREKGGGGGAHASGLALPLFFPSQPRPPLHFSQVDLPGGALPTTLTLRAHLPTDYPSTSAPILEALLPDDDPTAADAASTAVAAALEAAWGDTPGLPILYTVVEALREREEAIAVARQAAVDEEEAAGAAAKEGDEEDAAVERGGGGRGGDDDQPPEPTTATTTTADEAFAALASSLHITSHPPVVVKRSTFQAHVAPIACPGDAKAVVDALLTNRRIAAATHNVMAYRCRVDAATSGAICADCDDDGEAAAGGRLAFMLQAAKVEGAVVVVSRWFGGTLLGPSRFGVINNTARDALVAGGFITAAKDTGAGKKR